MASSLISLSSKAPPAPGGLVCLAVLGRRANLVGVRVVSPHHRQQGQSEWLQGRHGVAQANRFLRSLVEKGLPVQWRVRIEFELEDGTHGSIETVWPTARGRPRIEDLLVLHYTRIAASDGLPLADRVEARRLAELLLGNLLPSPILTAHSDLQRVRWSQRP